MARTKELEPRNRLKKFAAEGLAEAKRTTIRYKLIGPEGKPIFDRKRRQNVYAEEPKEHINWRAVDPRDRGYAAHLATTLEPFGEDETLLRPVFERFGLDHHNPYHWRRLAKIFAKTHWPNQRSEIDWKAARKHQLICDAKELIEADPELGTNDTALAKALRAQYPERYSSHSKDAEELSALRKALRKVRPELRPNVAGQN